MVLKSGVIDILGGIAVTEYRQEKMGASTSSEDISDRNAPWHGASKSESENLGGNNGFENAERKNNFEVEKVGRKNSVILNHIDFNHINTNSDNSNHANLNQFIQDDSTTIHDSADSFALNKYCHGMGTRWTHQLVQFLLEHHWLMYCQCIHPIHPIRYIRCIRTLRKLLHKKRLLMG